MQHFEAARLLCLTLNTPKANKVEGKHAKVSLHRRVGKEKTKNNSGDRAIFMFVLLEARLQQ